MRKMLLVAAVAVVWVGCESRDREARSGRISKRTEQTKPTGKSDPSLPTASISIDGKVDDWANVPVRVRNEPRDISTYKPMAVRVAADEEYLYVLFELGVGVRERFDKQVPTGQVSGGALGYLNLTVDGVKYRCWLPTGVSMSWGGSGRPSFELVMHYELMRAKLDTDEYETILEKEYPDDTGFFGITGKHVELKIPLESLGARPGSQWQIALDAF